jgi:magnesium chelatase accessory protein
MSARLDWTRDGQHWPHHACSTFVHAGGLRWHVQRMGVAGTPVALLVHGTGAATHSWRGLMPLLAQSHDVIAMDLPGHGFTTMPARAALSLTGMAGALTSLISAMGVQPTLAVGHSAGAAVLIRMQLDGTLPSAHLVSINGALLPLAGLVGRAFSPLAKLLAANPVVPHVFAWRASDAAVLQRLLDATGSKLDAEGTRLYGQLVANPGHAAAALAMMAAWDLMPLHAALPRLRAPLQLIVGSQDRTVPPQQARQVCALVKHAVLTDLPGLGHLAHEEQPAKVHRALEALLRTIHH